MGSLALRPGDSLTILEDGFVNRLQDIQFPSCLLFKLRGLGLLPRWDSHPLVNASLHWTHTYQKPIGSSAFAVRLSDLDFIEDISN